MRTSARLCYHAIKAFKIQVVCGTLSSLLVSGLYHGLGYFSGVVGSSKAHLLWAYLGFPRKNNPGE